MADDSFDNLAKRFVNDRNQPAEERVSRVEGRPGVRIFSYSFASPVAGRVPGILITPDRRGRFPVILFGHWMMNGSPMKNHKEFLDEAVVLARAGAICVLLDAPLVREGVVEDPELMHGQEANATVQMAREWRRALDLMLARPDADAGRVAYVGQFQHGSGSEVDGGREANTVVRVDGGCVFAARICFR